MTEPVPVAARVRRRGRTTLLIATAAVLGTVAGTCVGYLVQADREPTRLPSLSQPVLAQAKGKGPEPLSAAQDRRVKAEGDLRKLLVERPKGAGDGAYATDDDGAWMTLAEYADRYTEPDTVFRELVSDEFRRAAVANWSESGTRDVEVRLLQYRQEEKPAAAGYAESQRYWAEELGANHSWSIPGTGDGMAYVHDEPQQKAGYQPVYSAQAHAWRGDIAMEIWIYDTKPVPKKTIMDLAEQQMERL
ncbi:hypothetical protein ACIOKD_37535 [Streptomyces sp. NPDC087844]|uniref:hypothetical protein n=1 Tax=Streptomyces sp. NPDC087844 TaxID=3365805 RepID=UPI00382FE247